MNSLIKAIRDTDVAAVRELLHDPKWANWSERSGKNALYYLCGSDGNICITVRLIFVTYLFSVSLSGRPLRSRSVDARSVLEIKLALGGSSAILIIPAS